MSYFPSPEFLRIFLHGLLVGLHFQWKGLVNTFVPEPYLDEVFHVPQAQAFWRGDWLAWDPKITTPPGLYYFSHAIGTVRKYFDPEFEQTTQALRFVNVIAWYLLLIALTIWSAISREQLWHKNVLHRELAIVASPMLFFFSGLYYTDLLSTFSVVLTYIFWYAGSQRNGQAKITHQGLHFVSGALSLMTRQTNIFWVAVYLGGLQLIDTVKRKAGPKQIHDQPISEAFFEDFPITSISIAQHLLNSDIVFDLLLDLWPHLSLLAVFGGFVLSNGGVVLGDKSNHVATVHLPQMLYLWPAIVFFSWPVTLPFVVNIFTNKRNKLPLRSRFPRTATIVSFLIIAAATICFNTIIHPFTLADNRHYTFYVFRLLRIPAIKYAAIPVYIFCGWLCISALSTPATSIKTQDQEIVRVSWVLVFLISTSLSLITAPLVEPRYFIIPWLLWRLHVPEATPDRSIGEPNSTDDKTATQMAEGISVLHKVISYLTWLELVWYIVINAVTGYVFLFHGFSWPQEPGKVQRFMW